MAVKLGQVHQVLMVSVCWIAGYKETKTGLRKHDSKTRPGLFIDPTYVSNPAEALGPLEISSGQIEYREV
jgi:hypothetical protein